MSLAPTLSALYASKINCNKDPSPKGDTIQNLTLNMKKQNIFVIVARFYPNITFHHKINTDLAVSEFVVGVMLFKSDRSELSEI